MSNRSSAIPKPILGGPLSATGSSLMMQEATASTWPTRTPSSPDNPDSYTPRKLALVEPYSRPIFSVDPLAFKGDRTSSAVSFVIHAAAITLILSLALKARTSMVLQPTTVVTPVDFKLTVPPPITMPVAKVQGGGGGGGAHDAAADRGLARAAAARPPSRTGRSCWRTCTATRPSGWT